MDYYALESLRQRHPAWRLLAANNGPFVIAFLIQVFTIPNRRTLAQAELSARLEDHRYHLRMRLGEGMFPKRASDYLNDWADDSCGWLRKFYIDGSDEPHFDLTPASEKVIAWLQSLEQKQFIGTESRLKTIFDLLQQIARGTETDPLVRITELEQRRAAIDDEIARLRLGEIDLMDTTQLKERFYLVEQTARALLADFRQVEQNFRDLDRGVRERIALWDGSKGELLASVLGERDAIADSDQGKSFRAFWDFLMSPTRQEELSNLLARMLALDSIAQLRPDQRLPYIHHDWLEAGEAAQRTVARLSEQLRKYLDDQALAENRRIMAIIREIEQQALAVRTVEPGRDFMQLSDTSPTVVLLMDRTLFTPLLKPCITQQPVEAGEQAIQADALFEQVYVDKIELAARIRRALQEREQITLSSLIHVYPLQQGLAELIAYLSLAAENSKALIDDRHTQTVVWTDAYGRARQASLPMVIFNR